MNYFLLTARTQHGLGYWCANGITRFTNDAGEDCVMFICSSVPTILKIKDVICITPTTPTPDQIAALSK